MLPLSTTVTSVRNAHIMLLTRTNGADKDNDTDNDAKSDVA